MEIFTCGTNVIIKNGGLKAAISSISIRYDSVLYELCYFYEGEYKYLWAKEGEFTIEKDFISQKIGFK